MQESGRCCENVSWNSKKLRNVGGKKYSISSEINVSTRFKRDLNEI